MQTNRSNTIRQTLKPGAMPTLSASQQARLAAVSAMPDDQIDYSDAPFLPDAVWVRAATLPAGKQQITIRIDQDVLDFFRLNGARYQSRINAVLRSYVEAHKAQAK